MQKYTSKSKTKKYDYKTPRDRLRNKRKQLGLCIMCGKEPPKKTSTLGDKCHRRMVESRKALAKKRVSEGMCSQCIMEPASDGMKLCQKCRDRKKQTPSYRAAYTYGISEREYFDLLDEANGACMICGKAKKLNLDHCHTTGKVRGFLCSSCNNGLGRFFDDENLLKSAITYLRKSRHDKDT